MSRSWDTFVKVAFEGELPTPTQLPDKSLFKVELGWQFACKSLLTFALSLPKEKPNEGYSILGWNENLLKFHFQVEAKFLKLL